MCPNPALHAVHQEVDLRPLLQQIRGLGRSANTAEERAIGARVTAAELRVNRRSTTSTGTIHLSLSAAERGEEDTWRDWHGRVHQQPQVEAPCGACGACGEPVLDRHSFAFAGLIAHTEYAVENIQGASDRGDDRFGVPIGRGDGPPRRRTFRLTEIVPRVYHIYDGATEWGVHRRGQR